MPMIISTHLLERPCSEESFERVGRVLELELLAGEVPLMPNEALQDGKLFRAGVDGKVGRQDVLLEVEDGEGSVLEAAPNEDLVVFGLIAGEFQVEIKDVGPDVGHEIVCIAGSRPVLSWELPAVLRVAPVLHPPSLGKHWVLVIRDIASGIDVRMG